MIYIPSFKGELFILYCIVIIDGNISVRVIYTRGMFHRQANLRELATKRNTIEMVEKIIINTVDLCNYPPMVILVMFLSLFYHVINPHPQPPFFASATTEAQRCSRVRPLPSLSPKICVVGLGERVVAMGKYGELRL